jgi:hypothetical protein
LFWLRGDGQRGGDLDEVEGAALFGVGSASLSISVLVSW